MGLLLAEVGKRNNIEATTEEVERAMADQASRSPGQEQEVISFYRGNPQAIEQLKGPILEDKVVDFILEVAEVTEKRIFGGGAFGGPARLRHAAAGKKDQGQGETESKTKSESCPPEQAGEAESEIDEKVISNAFF